MSGSPREGMTEMSAVMMAWPVQKQAGKFLALMSTRYAKTLAMAVEIYSIHKN